MYEFKVGDRVQFKPEDYYYRDVQRAPNEFTIVKVYAKCAYWDWEGRKGAFFRRLILINEGPW